MTLQTLAPDKSPPPPVNGGKSMKFTFQPESKPLDGYTIKRAIHRGGFGEVYYALTDAGKEVALKLLKQHFDVELRGVSQCLNLKHANLVTIFDVKRDADGDHWVIMEYVAGKSLSQVLDDYPNGMPMDEVRTWLAGLVDGLSFLHDRGIVHRDLKPGNVFLESGVVKIGDVGLSKFISESHRSAQTQSVGTVYYMAPEVAHGRYGREVDVYSLGIVLYELLTGRVPFIGESAGEILMKHLSEKPDLSPIPRRLRPVLASALEKDPLRRTPTVRQLLEDFKKAIDGFDVPQEIPEESFLNVTIADSSTLEEELRAKAAGRSERPVPPNLKDIIAADVARAMEVAENAARRAKEMANEAYRASKGHRRHSSRFERKMERLARSQKRYRDKYATFWGWKECQNRGSRQAQAGGVPPVYPANNPPPPVDRRGRSRGWVKPVVIAIVIMALASNSRAFGPPRHHSIGAFIPLVVLAAVVYVAYRVFNGTRSGGSFARGSATPAATQPPPIPMAEPVVDVRPAQYARTVPPPAPAQVRRAAVLGPDTPALHFHASTHERVDPVADVRGHFDRAHHRGPGVRHRLVLQRCADCRIRGDVAGRLVVVAGPSQDVGGPCLRRRHAPRLFGVDRCGHRLAGLLAPSLAGDRYSNNQQHSGRL